MNQLLKADFYIPEEKKWGLVYISLIHGTELSFTPYVNLKKQK